MKEKRTEKKTAEDEREKSGKGNCEDKKLKDNIRK